MWGAPGVGGGPLKLGGGVPESSAPPGPKSETGGEEAGVCLWCVCLQPACLLNFFSFFLVCFSHLGLFLVALGT